MCSKKSPAVGPCCVCVVAAKRTRNSGEGNKNAATTLAHHHHQHGDGREPAALRVARQPACLAASLRLPQPRRDALGAAHAPGPSDALFTRRGGRSAAWRLAWDSAGCAASLPRRTLRAPPTRTPSTRTRARSRSMSRSSSAARASPARRATGSLRPPSALSMSRRPSPAACRRARGRLARHQRTRSPQPLCAASLRRTAPCSAPRRAAARAAAEMQAAEAACRALLWEYLALRAQADTDAAAAREWEEAAAEPTLCAATLTPTAVDDDDDGGWEVVSSADKAGEEVEPPSPSAASTASSFVSVGPDGAAPLAPSPHRAAHTVARTKDPQRRHARNRRTGGGGGGSGGGRSGVSTERHLAAWDALTTVVGDCRAAHSRPVLRALARFYRLVPSDRLLAPAPPEGGHVVRVVARVAASTPRREVTDLAGVSLTAALGGGGGGAATAHASLEGGSTGARLVRAADDEPPPLGAADHVIIRALTNTAAADHRARVVQFFWCSRGLRS